MSRRRRAASALLALTAVVALSACTEADNGNNTLADDPTTPAPSTPQGGPQSTAPAAGGVETDKIEAKDNEFVPKAIKAKAGKITFTMTNNGAAPHTFTSADLGVDVNVNAGQSAPIDIADAKPGTYKFVCKYHETLGMTGELTVT